MKITEILQILSDSTRLRILKLLQQEELSVAELQEILEMGQSRISSHLSLMRRNEMVKDRKDGKKTFYALSLEDSKRYDLIRMALSEDSDEDFWESDRTGLARVLDRRIRESERYFDEVAERLGRNYVPGSVMGIDWAFSLSLGAGYFDCRLGCGGRNDFPTFG